MRTEQGWYAAMGRRVMRTGQGRRAARAGQGRWRADGALQGQDEDSGELTARSKDRTRKAVGGMARSR